MNLGSCDEGSDAAAAFDETLTFQGSEGVAGSHQADLVHFGEIPLGRNGVARAKLAGVNTFADGALDALVSGNTGADFLGRHARTPKKRDPDTATAKAQIACNEGIVQQRAI